MASSAELGGIMVALITPFTQDKKAIDVTALDQHINRLVELGLHGLVPGGSTGEFTVLTIDERKILLEQCVKAAAGRVPVIAGIGELSTDRTVELAVHGAKAGAAAAMVVPPFYDHLDIDQVKEYLSEIYHSSQLPIVYYNFPSVSGVNLSPSELASLSDVGVKYLKDTSGNVPALTELLFSQDHTSKITSFNGWDTLTFYGLLAGAKGSIWGAKNITPELSMQLWDAIAVNGDLILGRQLWTKIWPICAFLEQCNYSAAVKTGMEIRGWTTGGLRKPFDLLQGEGKEKLKQLLLAAGVEIE